MLNTRHTRWLIILLIVLTLVSIALNIFHQPNNSSGFERTISNYISELRESKPKDGSNGQDATVNYDRIESYIEKRIASVPRPQNGQNGVNGTNGSNGAPGSSCSTAKVEGGATILCTDGTSSFVSNGSNGTNGQDGQDGSNGTDGKTPDLRCNVAKNRWEIRYSEDEAYRLLNGRVIPCTTGN